MQLKNGTEKLKMIIAISHVLLDHKLGNLIVDEGVMKHMYEMQMTEKDKEYTKVIKTIYKWFWEEDE